MARNGAASPMISRAGDVNCSVHAGMEFARRTSELALPQPNDPKPITATLGFASASLKNTSKFPCFETVDMSIIYNIVTDTIKGLAGKYTSVLPANHGPVVAGQDLEGVAFAIEELEKAAKLHLLLHNFEPRQPSPSQGLELARYFDLPGYPHSDEDE